MTSQNKFGYRLRPQWLLDEKIFFLNHGSFGATPKVVLAAQTAWREQLERQPVYFMGKVFPPALRSAAEDLAQFLHTQGNQLAFVENATSGINAVLRSFLWKPGDELIISNHLYTGVKNTARYISKRYNVILKEINIPFTVFDTSEIVNHYRHAINSKTRLVLLDHVAAFSSLVFPIKQITEIFKEHNIPVLVDGAHAAGMIDLNLEELDVDWYAGNCHKWLFAPKGCAFLWRAANNQMELHPAVISNHYGKAYPMEFDWAGTRDPSTWLSITAALEFYRSLGEKNIRDYNHDLAIQAANFLTNKWGIQLNYPENCYGSIVSLPLPRLNIDNPDMAARLHDLLWERYKIEVPLASADGQIYLRISAQVYNEMADYKLLADVIPSVIEEFFN